MLFEKNTYEHNIAYGLDPHDDSDSLTITGNTFSRNGNHGLICSQRCDHLLIKDNKSENNVNSTAQVHGIMLHRGVTNSVIEGNVVTGNSTGGGIAIFDSIGNEIKNNTIIGNKYGLRFSVGTKDLVVSGNTVKNSVTNAVYTYKGSDVPSFTGSTGRPTNITFTDNTFDGAGSDLFKIQDSDSFTFTGGSVSGGARGPLFERAGTAPSPHEYGPVTTPNGMTFTLKGINTSKTNVVFKGIDQSAIKVVKDTNSTATFQTAA
jgi:parallel beta-helix repeat protein